MLRFSSYPDRQREACQAFVERAGFVYRYADTPLVDVRAVNQSESE
jgi:hypothetical protein